MIREVNLINHLPKYLQNYKQLKIIMQRLTPELQLIEDETEIIKDNQFIANCNETGITMFENLLSICPSIDDDLQTRIDRVLLKWLDFPPYTLRYLLNVLDNLFGSGNYDFNEDFLNYAFSINFTNNFLPSDLESFYKFIANIKPANLCFNITANSTVSSEAFCGVTLAGKYVNTRFIFDDISNDITQKLSKIDAFYSPIIASNY